MLVDGRWRGYTGVGRVTDLFVRGLAELAESERLWGWRVWTRTDDQARFGRMATVPTGHRPTALFGQRDLLAVPQADETVWLHAVRPLIHRASAVLVHDVIPVTRYPRPQREVWRLYFKRSLATADRVLCYSDATQERVESLFRIPATRIGRFDLTIDTGLADRVRAKRARPDVATAPDRRHLLYVGQFKKHKNLDRAVKAFARSRTAASGRPFVLVGGRLDECDAIRRVAIEAGAKDVRVRARCSDAELVDLYASAGALIQPSLEEGYGLTVLEALVAGIPVACSAIPTHVDASRGEASFFDAEDLDAIAAAIDAAVAAPSPKRPSVPTLPEFAADLLRAAELL